MLGYLLVLYFQLCIYTFCLQGTLKRISRCSSHLKEARQGLNTQLSYRASLAAALYIIDVNSTHRGNKCALIRKPDCHNSIGSSLYLTVRYPCDHFV